MRWRRWTATIAGFLGVPVMVRPGAGTFQPASLAALTDSFSVAFLVTLVKHLPATETPLTMLFYSISASSQRFSPSARRSIPGNGRRPWNGCC